MRWWSWWISDDGFIKTAVVLFLLWYFEVPVVCGVRLAVQVSDNGNRDFEGTFFVEHNLDVATKQILPIFFSNPTHTEDDNLNGTPCLKGLHNFKVAKKQHAVPF